MSDTYNLCLDIGGTKVLGAIFDENRDIVYRLKKKTKSEGHSTENVEQVIVSVVEEMIAGSGIEKKADPRHRSSCPRRDRSGPRGRVDLCQSSLGKL